MKRRGMTRLDKKNGRSQLVKGLEERLGSDTEDSFMHCPPPAVRHRSDKGKTWKTEVVHML